jgi:hypothetical protein
MPQTGPIFILLALSLALNATGVQATEHGIGDDVFWFRVTDFSEGREVCVNSRGQMGYNSLTVSEIEERIKGELI